MQSQKDKMFRRFFFAYLFLLFTRFMCVCGLCHRRRNALTVVEIEGNTQHIATGAKRKIEIKMICFVVPFIFQWDFGNECSALLLLFLILYNFPAFCSLNAGSPFEILNFNQ